MKVSEEEQNALKQDILHYVSVKMTWDEATVQAWWYRQNQNFGEMSPKEMVESGMGKHLLSYIRNI